MNKLTEWDYESSVRRVSAKVGELKLVTIKRSTLTDDIAGELYEARKQLSDRGSKWNDDQNWTSFLAEVGLARTTVHTWLDHYEPSEQRLLSDDEYQAKKAAERRQQMEAEHANRDRVNQAIKTNSKPDDWNDEAEKLYKKRLNEDAERDERIRLAKENQDRLKQSRENKYKIDDDIDELLDRATEQHKQKQQFAEKIGLSGNNAGHGFNDVLQDYLRSLATDTEKIEACHNIIKICKGVVSELQTASIR